MKIQVLGSGCPTCAKLNELVNKAVDEMKIENEVEYLTGPEGIKKMAELGTVSSPVLVVNDQVVITGFISDLEKIKRVIKEHLKK